MSKVVKDKEVKKTWKEKVHDELTVWKETGKIFWNNLKEHPEAIGYFVSGMITIGGAGIALIGNQKSKEEESCRIHESITGFDWVTTHPLTNQELLEVNRRLYDEQIKGLGEALEAEGYLKKEKKRR